MHIRTFAMRYVSGLVLVQILEFLGNRAEQIAALKT